MADVEKRVIGKVMWRLIPFLIVCYFVAYLDRVNVGFAKLHIKSGTQHELKRPPGSAPACSSSDISSSKCLRTSSSNELAHASGSPAS